MDGRNISVGGAAQLATMFDEEAAQLPGTSFLFASGDNVGASPANSGLLEDMPAIDVENAWGLDATSYGNHEFDYGIDRLLRHQARANFPFLGANIVDEVTGLNPDWVQGTHVFDFGNLRIGVIGIELENARTGERRRYGRSEVPARSRDHPGRVREAAPAGHQGSGGADPRRHSHGQNAVTATLPIPGKARS